MNNCKYIDDLRYMIDELEKVSPGLYESINKEELSNEKNILTIDSVKNDKEFYRILISLLKYINTEANMNETKNSEELILPNTKFKIRTSTKPFLYENDKSDYVSLVVSRADINNTKLMKNKQK